MTSLSQHVTYGTAGHWRFEFPNGHGASVIADPRGYLFRFEVAQQVDGRTIDSPNAITPGLTTAEVEAKLAEIMALPTAEAA